MGHSLRFFTFLAPLALSSCAFHPADIQHATCTTLKSNIIFSGSTSNVRESQIQRAEKPLQEKSYDKNNC